MTLQFPQNSIEHLKEISGKSVALLQLEKAVLVNKIQELHREVKFLEGVRSNISNDLIDKETEESKVAELRVKEYKQLVSFISKLKDDNSLLRLQNRRLGEEHGSIQIDIERTKSEKEQIREKISALTNVFNEKRKVYDEKIKRKTEDDKTLSHSLAVKKQELDKVCESIQKEKETMVGEKAEHKAFQKFLERKAADLMRMERKLMVEWNNIFPGKPMLYKEKGELVDTLEAFVSNKSDITN